jgi:hypothetical protein
LFAGELPEPVMVIRGHVHKHNDTGPHIPTNFLQNHLPEVSAPLARHGE